MFKIDTDTAIDAMPTPAAVGTPGYFRKGNEGTSELATQVDADWLNSVQSEMVNVISNASITLSKTDRTQLYDAIVDIIQNYSGGAVSNPLTADLPLNTISSSTNGIEVEATLGDIVFDCDNLYVFPLIWQTDHTNFINGAFLSEFAVQFHPDNSFSMYAMPTLGLNLNNSGASVTTILDEDSFASNSATKLFTQQSFKAYVDAQIPSPVDSVNEDFEFYLYGFSDTPINASQSYYVSLGVSNSVSLTLGECPMLCLNSAHNYVLSDFRVYLSSAPGTGASVSASIRKITLPSTVSSGIMSLTISDTSLNNIYSTPTTVTGTDALQVVLTSSAGLTTINRMAWSVKVRRST